MKKQIVASIVGVAITLSAGTAMAKSHDSQHSEYQRKTYTHQQHKNYTNYVQKQLKTQERKVSKMQKKGQLLRREANFLRENISGARRSLRYAKADHHISKHEQKRLNFLVKRNARLIHAWPAL